MWRAFVLWLLVAAIPVQGIAARTLLHCAPAHHAGSLAVPHADTATVPHDLDAHVGAAPAKKATSHVKSSCSACSACCCASAPPPTQGAWGVPAAADFMLAAPSTRTVAFLTDALDRPPR